MPGPWILLAAAAVCTMWSQTPVPPREQKPPSELSLEALRNPPPPEAKPKEETPAPAVKPHLENQGKPMRVAVACGEEEIHALGLTCPPEEPCPVYLELSDVESVGTKIFLSGNLHTSSATLSSVLLASDDGGKTWFEPYERLDMAGLEQIQFIDFEAGWIAGHLIRNLPRDPFLLITTNGGETWRRKPVLEDGGVGAIEHLWFESRNQGSIIIDRSRSGEPNVSHELRESMTGGESWSLREVSSKPIRPKRLPSAQASLRLRPDAASKSYRVERQQGEKWVAIASFLVHAGDCRANERVLAEPPELEEQLEPETEDPAKKDPPPRKKPILKKPGR